MSNLTEKWGQVITNTYGTPPVAFVSGKGATLTDEEGKTYIDMLAGIAVNSLGYGHPAVVQAVSEQVAKVGHVSNLFASEPVVNAAGKRSLNASVTGMPAYSSAIPARKQMRRHSSSHA